jgi:SAM-dependent methyltransferase
MARHLNEVEQRRQYREVNFAGPWLQEIKLDIHRRFSDRPIDIHREVVFLADIRPYAAVVDVGCGTGDFLRYLRFDGHHGPLIGLDVADGVFSSAARRRHTYSAKTSFAVADATRLPVGDESVDAVCLQHMLGYVPDMAAACAEARRLLRPGGVVVATANSRHNYPHALKYRERARQLFGWPPMETNTDRFCVENMADVLGPALGAVRVEVRDGRLRVPRGDYWYWFAQMMFNWNPLPSVEEEREILDRLANHWLPADANRRGDIVETKQVGIAWCRTPRRSAR